MEKMQKMTKSTKRMQSKVKHKLMMKQEKQAENKKIEDEENERRMVSLMDRFRVIEENIQKQRVRTLSSLPFFLCRTRRRSR